MDNYIGKIEAEWVDPAVELPPDGWRGLAINSDGDVVYATAHVPRVLLGCLVAWLRISGPSDAIPREAVQAAVLEMRGEPPWGCDTWEHALDILQAHCGIEAEPSGTEDSSVAQEAPDA
jgi:hypothetical protein